MSEGQTELPRARAFLPLMRHCVCLCVCMSQASHAGSFRAYWFQQGKTLRSPGTLSLSHQSAFYLVVSLLPAFCCSFIPSCHFYLRALTPDILPWTIQGIFCALFYAFISLISLPINVCFSSVHLNLSWITICHLNNSVFLLHQLWRRRWTALSTSHSLSSEIKENCCQLLRDTLIEWPFLIAEAITAAETCNVMWRETWWMHIL